MTTPLVAGSKKGSKSSSECDKKDKKKETNMSDASSDKTFHTEDLDDLSKASSVLSKTPLKLEPQFMSSWYSQVLEGSVGIARIHV